jgi:glycosyltransferase involved in cell wall biosynthesis
VLVSDHREDDVVERGAAERPDVHRELRWYWHDHAFPRIGPARTLAIERHNHAVLARHLAEHRPDVVVFWGMGGMSLSLIGAVRAAGIPEVFVVADRWPVYGPVFDRFAKGIRPLGPARGPLARALGSAPPRGPEGTVLVTSAALAAELGRRRAIPRDAVVAHPGVALPEERPSRAWSGRLLWLGRLDGRGPGPALAVDGFARAVADAGVAGFDLRLTIAGEGDAAATRTLRDAADAARVGARVTIRGRAEGDELAELLRAHDALLTPVRASDPTTPDALAALAHGIPTIAVGEQESEHLDAHNVLRVPDGDPGPLADAIRRLASDPALRERLRAAGHATAEELDEERFRDRVADAVVDAAGAGAR